MKPNGGGGGSLSHVTESAIGLFMSLEEWKGKQFSYRTYFLFLSIIEIKTDESSE